MVNLIVSTLCNANCEYCFAKSFLVKYQKRQKYMSLIEYTHYLDFFQMEDVRLLGGEPTLHPDFPELVRVAEKRGKHLTIFSNGLMPKSAFVALDELPNERCTVIVNDSAQFEHLGIKDDNFAPRDETLKRLGKKVMLGVNLSTIDFDLEEVINAIQKYHLSNVVRLGISLPDAEKSNVSIHPKQYPVLGKRIIEWAKIAARFGIYFDLDCGFVRCMFSDEDIQVLQQGGMKPGWHCNPILDVCPGGTILHCFPLSMHRIEKFSPETTAASLRREFYEQTRPYLSSGIYPKCSTCPYKDSGECNGGCIALTCNRFRPANINFEVIDEI